MFAAQETPIQLVGLGNHLRCDDPLSVTFHVLAYEFQVCIYSKSRIWTQLHSAVGLLKFLPIWENVAYNQRTLKNIFLWIRVGQMMQGWVVRPLIICYNCIFWIRLRAWIRWIWRLIWARWIEKRLIYCSWPCICLKCYHLFFFWY